MATEHYQVAVIGGGPGGYAAAVRVAAHGKSVCLIEREQLGGVCLNWGCIPTKALLRSAHLFAELSDAAALGIDLGSAHFNMPRCQQRKQGIIEQLRKGMEFICRKSGISLIAGTAAFENARTLCVDGARAISFEQAVVAVGSRPAALPGVCFDAARGILSSSEALSLSRVPESLCIIGGGVIGCEFADLFASLRCRVTIVEQASQLCPWEDTEIMEMLAASLRRKGVAVMTGATVQRVASLPDGECLVTTADGISHRVEAVLVAVGRMSAADNLGLAQAGIELSRGWIPVNEYMQTAAPAIYAVGDAVGRTFLAHAAAREGIVAADHLSGAGSRRAMEYGCVPRCIYTRPQVASVGLNAAAAAQQQRAVVTAAYSYMASGKALIENARQGMVKLVADAADGTVCGASIIGAQASELIHEVALAVSAGVKMPELAGIIHAHPTLAEAIGEAALSAGA
ncbi:MAG: dihydrolipoyl dehydrogenase [Candidatus Omnitrophica bacterium]|nr:dihydrolipoyl dehydrogenase [Candidatus Omnitrophota bacterium]